MHKYSLVYTKFAEADLYDIFWYIAVKLCNKSAAEKIESNILKALENARMFPEAAPRVDINPALKKEHRKITVDNYIIFYVIDNEKEQIVVMRVLYASRDWARLL